MNACLMKVNFNPKYVVPHKKLSKQDWALDNLNSRLKIASEVYGTAEKKLKDIKDSREATECSIKSDGKENLKSSIYKTVSNSQFYYGYDRLYM